MALFLAGGWRILAPSSLEEERRLFISEEKKKRTSQGPIQEQGQELQFQKKRRKIREEEEVEEESEDIKKEIQQDPKRVEDLFCFWTTSSRRRLEAQDLQRRSCSRGNLSLCSDKKSLHHATN